MSSSSSSAASMGALAAATAMAVSGSLVLFSLRRFAKPASEEPASPLRSCLASSGTYYVAAAAVPKRARRKGEKRVRFAEGVVDNEGAAPPVRRSPSPPPAPAPEPTCRTTDVAGHRMPANREALYRGMLRERSVHRTAYSY
ncbi:uncharacterized protein LOC124686750 isoform X1 [Lolium rigidum]|uniref:uncharacterized protein LOC124686750 isoform X1 n=1 Tax=Lolium rigidum TaxID=89674 RepID=UPI001F5D9CBE|nr:uncharacterized protein LOC124686750 isoform X1 [Lolium rigidum]